MIPYTDFTKDDILGKVIARQLQAEDELLKNVLMQCLKREVIPEDAKRLTKIISLGGNREEYTLLFDEVKIGIVDHIWVENSFTIRFTPIEIFRNV